MADMSGLVEMVTSGLEKRWAGKQAIVALATRGDAAEAELWLFECNEGKWKVTEGPWPALVGRNGVSKKAEGDGRSPSGAFLLGTAFGLLGKPANSGFPYRMLDSADRLVDDSSSPFYNRWVRGSAVACGNGEDLSLFRQYDHAVVVHFNDEAIYEAGSAIFIHGMNAENFGTRGCTAISEEHMARLLEWLDYSKRPVLVQGTQEEITQLMAEDWNMLCLSVGWGFVDDFIPDAQLEIRYNTANNFTGRKVPGYHASVAPMRMEAIVALATIADELRDKNFGLRVYDAYRPQLATDAMIAWAEDASDILAKDEYYPSIDKAFIPDHYVARRSNHRLGGTVDLTLLRWENGQNLDMGGMFDYFGTLSSFGYEGLTAPQAANRALLRDVMVSGGFQPLNSEWWHFTAKVGGQGGEFAILPREHVHHIK